MPAFGLPQTTAKMNARFLGWVPTLVAAITAFPVAVTPVAAQENRVEIGFEVPYSVELEGGSWGVGFRVEVGDPLALGGDGPGYRGLTLGFAYDRLFPDCGVQDCRAWLGSLYAIYELDTVRLGLLRPRFGAGLTYESFTRELVSFPDDTDGSGGFNIRGGFTYESSSPVTPYAELLLYLGPDRSEGLAAVFGASFRVR